MVAVTIKYQGSHGSSEEINVEASDLVSSVKEKIANFSDGSRLVFEGRELDDDSKPLSFFKFVPATLYGTWFWVMGPRLEFDESKLKFVIAEEHPAAAHLSKEQVATHNLGTTADPDGKVYAEVTGKPSPLIDLTTSVDGALFDPPTGKGTVLLLPGQGTQKPGMIDPFLSTPGVKEMFDVAQEVFGMDLLELCQKGPAEKLNDTTVSQPAVFLTSLASIMKLKADDPAALDSCDVVAGFSLGEYTALVVAGAMDLRTALTVIKKRGEAMGKAAAVEKTGMLSVVGLEDSKIDELCSEFGCSVANQLMPKGRVLAGKVSDLEAAQAKANDIGALKTQMLKVSGAFHSKYMEPALSELQGCLGEATFLTPSRTVYSNVNGKPHADEEDEIKRLMGDQLTNGVRWQDTIENMLKAGTVSKFIEAAPGSQLKAMMKRIDMDSWGKTEALATPSKK